MKSAALPVPMDGGRRVLTLPLHPAASWLRSVYSEDSGHGADEAQALFRPLHHWRDPPSSKGMTPGAVYERVRGYSKALGFAIRAHSLRAKGCHDLPAPAKAGAFFY